MSGHLAQLGQHAVDVLGSIDESDDEREFAAGVYERGGLHALASGEARDGVEDGGPGHVLRAQELEDGQVQRLALIRVGLVDVDGDLDGHRVRHSICTSDYSTVLYTAGERRAGDDGSEAEQGVGGDVRGAGQPEALRDVGAGLEGVA